MTNAAPFDTGFLQDALVIVFAEWVRLLELRFIGAFRSMPTVQLRTGFLRPFAGDAGEARVNATVLCIGKTLAVGETRIATGADHRLAARSTTTCALR